MISFILWDCEEKKLDALSNIPISESICSKVKFLMQSRKIAECFYFYHFKIFIFFETFNRI
jgi:hypothetical protein